MDLAERSDQGISPSDHIAIHGSLAADQPHPEPTIDYLMRRDSDQRGENEVALTSLSLVERVQHISEGPKPQNNASCDQVNLIEANIDESSLNLRFADPKILGLVVPELDPGQGRSRGIQQWLNARHVLLGIKQGLAWTVASGHLAIVIWALSTHEIRGDRGTLKIGHCNEVQNLNTWLHLALNIISTLLLGAANSSMQLLAAPTIREVRKVLAQGKSLDIGIQVSATCSA